MVTETWNGANHSETMILVYKRNKILQFLNSGIGNRREIFPTKKPSLARTSRQSRHSHFTENYHEGGVGLWWGSYEFRVPYLLRTKLIWRETLLRLLIRKHFYIVIKINFYVYSDGHFGITPSSDCISKNTSIGNVKGEFTLERYERVWGLPESRFHRHIRNTDNFGRSEIEESAEYQYKG